MVDIHTHALPDIDDGANDAKESIQMLTMAKSHGVDVCVLTPHCRAHSSDDIEKFVQRRNESFELLKYTTGINVRAVMPELMLGAEVFLDNDLSAYDNISKLCIGESKKMLIEFDFAEFDPKYGEWIYALNLKGIVPIIAHVDRYEYRNRIFDELDGLQVIYQINAGRFLTISGRHTVKKLLKMKHCFIVSSDMHGLNHRPCNMMEARKISEKLFKDITDSLFSGNAEKVLYAK